MLSHDGADLAAALQTIHEVGDVGALDEAVGKTRDAWAALGLKILQEKIQTQRHALHSVEQSPRVADDKKRSFLGKLLAK